MLYAVLSPAKKLDFSPVKFPLELTTPTFFKHCKKILKVLQQLSCNDLAQLMKLGPKLAELNYQRFQNFSLKFTPQNSKPAIWAFAGETYRGLNASKFTTLQLEAAQQQIRILSGFYGILRPSDQIQPYRLEMSTPLSIYNHKNLYQFWQTLVTSEIKQLLSTPNSYLINLASEEYFKVIDVHQLSEQQIITPLFKVVKDGKLKSIGMMSKRARGMMANFIITQQLNTPQQLLQFSADGFCYQAKDSTPQNPLFIKK